MLGGFRFWRMALVGYALAATATAQAADKRLILLTNGSSEFWGACRVGLLDAQKELDLSKAGLTAVLEENDGTPKGQIDKLRQFGTQNDIAGVAVSALDANNVAVAEEMRKLRKKGVHIICVDADVDRNRLRDARSYYIGTDNVRGGQALGKAAKALLESRNKKSGSYVQFVGRTGSHNARERMDGFKEAVGANYKEADRMADETQRTKAQENVRNAINNHADLVALVGIWSYNAPAIVDVVKEKNVAGKHVLVAFDAEPLAVQHMTSGLIDAMVVQNPYDMGYQSVRLLKAMVEKDEATIKRMFPNSGPNADIYDTGLKVVVPDEKSPLKADLFGQGVQFMPLGDFKQWLSKYNLKGS